VFEVVCPKNADGLLTARRARRTGDGFWGCLNYPKCDYATPFEPLGGLHDADQGPIARQGDASICLMCGASIEVNPDAVVPGHRYVGGQPKPATLARPRQTSLQPNRAGVIR
jgi:hypothetical protein